MKKHQLFLTTLQKKLPAYYKLVILYIDYNLCLWAIKKVDVRKPSTVFIFLYFHIMVRIDGNY